MLRKHSSGVAVKRNALAIVNASNLLDLIALQHVPVTSTVVVGKKITVWT